MSTPKQIDANGRNAQKSTGPRSAEGKTRRPRRTPRRRRPIFPPLATRHPRRVLPRRHPHPVQTPLRHPAVHRKGVSEPPPEAKANFAQPQSAQSKLGSFRHFALPPDAATQVPCPVPVPPALALTRRLYPKAPSHPRLNLSGDRPDEASETSIPVPRLSSAAPRGYSSRAGRAYPSRRPRRRAALVASRIHIRTPARRPPSNRPPKSYNIIDYDSPHRTCPSRDHAVSRRRPPACQQERSMGARRQPVELVSARPIHRHPGRHEGHRLHRHPHDAVPADPQDLQHHRAGAAEGVVQARMPHHHHLLQRSRARPRPARRRDLAAPRPP